MVTLAKSKTAAVAVGDDDMGLVDVELPSGSVRDLSVTGWGAARSTRVEFRRRYHFCSFSARLVVEVMQIWAFDARTGAHRPLTSSSTRLLRVQPVLVEFQLASWRPLRQLQKPHCGLLSLGPELLAYCLPIRGKPLIAWPGLVAEW